MELALFSTVSQRDPAKSQNSIFMEACDQVGLAEQLGFGTAWFPEHHFTNYSICPNPTMLAAYAAARTSRIKVGPAVVVVPLHHPIRVVEELALLDQLSDGRLAIGLGGGYQEFEFHKFGLEIAKNRAYFSDFLEIFNQYMSTGAIEFDGTLASIPKTLFTLRPKQRAPQVYIASGTTDAAVQKRMVSGQYASIVSMVANSTDWVIEKRGQIEEVYRACGGPAPVMPFALNQYLYVTQDPKAARKAAEAVIYVIRVHAAMKNKEAQLDGSLMKNEPAPNEPTVDELLGRLAIGDPETVAERLVRQRRALRPVQMSFIMGLPGMSSAETLVSMELFGKSVMPHLNAVTDEAEEAGEADVASPALKEA
ncbi:MULTISPECIES: LLM class flavin-dependent oxidoreductase [Paraburkholderia]|uniref:LLM class flavin-dependent oxidoreductase n=1 Tax=Paraburkholderia TaxID=1822464 RepID=UPI00037B40BD|nr:MULTISPECIES: LLM class flavin-dependent oxidoreductase [Paraburkholderia]MDH6147557.1 alkanesulfonate monooxygenase SsuD/methylene tetrahydromethanopterin reductase-like flavin-dependent oxidoreductase (luciferase family) [Paraburkholderia sp. WSM4179]